MLFDPSALAQYSVVDVYVNGSVYSLYLTVYTNGRRFFISSRRRKPAQPTYSCFRALRNLGPGVYAPFLSVSSADAPFLIYSKGLAKCEALSTFTPLEKGRFKSLLGSLDRPFPHLLLDDSG